MSRMVHIPIYQQECYRERMSHLLDQANTLKGIDRLLSDPCVSKLFTVCMCVGGKWGDVCVCVGVFGLRTATQI